MTVSFTVLSTSWVNLDYLIRDTIPDLSILTLSEHYILKYPLDVFWGRYISITLDDVYYLFTILFFHDPQPSADFRADASNKRRYRLLWSTYHLLFVTEDFKNTEIALAVIFLVFSSPQLLKSTSLRMPPPILLWSWLRLKCRRTSSRWSRPSNTALLTAGEDELHTDVLC